MISKDYVWLYVCSSTWYAMHKRFFEDYYIRPYPVHVNFHIITLDDSRCINCTCKYSRRYGMPCPMTLSITKVLDPLIFHPRWYKTHNSHLNTPSYPKIYNLLQKMASEHRSKEGGFHVNNLTDSINLGIYSNNHDFTQE